MVLHAKDATTVGNKIILVGVWLWYFLIILTYFLLNVATQLGDTCMFIVLLYHIADSNTEVWMLPGTSRVMKWLPANLAAKLLPQSVLSDILIKSLHTEAITGCNTL